MKSDLETLKLVIEDYLPKHDFVAFHGATRILDDDLEVVRWDVENHPEYQTFLEVARRIGVKLIVFAFLSDHLRGASANFLDIKLQFQIELESFR